MKGCVQWNPFTVVKISPRKGIELGTARSLGQCLTHRATRALSYKIDLRFFRTPSYNTGNTSCSKPFFCNGFLHTNINDEILHPQAHF